MMENANIFVLLHGNNHVNLKGLMVHTSADLLSKTLLSKVFAYYYYKIYTF